MSSARFYRRCIVKKMWLTRVRLVILRCGQFRIFQKMNPRSRRHLVGLEKLIYRSGPMNFSANP